ncbi:phytanoyl-CoA dioxygenase family protein [Dermatobacter hominis]|uniref:phytanoyl-CoA dioxygenase family protein n=1 Tax=Dermatobacter hominis TaxID=2884263 RepID=UPI001D0F72C9|nr:phytanoyl-CoA dioxygenase family protein [Dermatobacter hominis]UDY36321.1 phytanoyl-CoA dioxygenase family protein [Dermatobacter hominis]
MRLDDDDLRRFATDGHLLLPGVVDEALLAAADAEVDELVAGTPPMEGDGGPGVNAWFEPRARLPRCEDVLRRSPALSLAEQLVDPLGLDFAFDHVQVSTTTAPYDHIPGGPHIDGHAPGQDPPASFTLLVGVLLSDQSEPSTGNLWVWPGSHLDHQQLFRERGTKVLQGSGGHSTLIPDPPVLARQVPVLGRRGDLVLAHHLLGHNKGGNTAPQQRRTLYYRLAATGHTDRWEATYLDAWTEYAPVRAAVVSA